MAKISRNFWCCQAEHNKVERNWNTHFFTIKRPPPGEKQSRVCELISLCTQSGDMNCLLMFFRFARGSKVKVFRNDALIIQGLTISATWGNSLVWLTPWANLHSCSGHLLAFKAYRVYFFLFFFSQRGCQIVYLCATPRKLRTQAQDKPLSYTDTQLRLSLVAHCNACAWQAGWWKVTAGKELIIDYDSNGKASPEFYFKNSSVRVPPETIFISENDPRVGEFNSKMIW